MEILNTQEINSNDFNHLKNKKFRFKKLFLYIICIFLVVIFLNFLFLSAPNNFPKGFIASIKQGENLRDLSLSLQENKIIRSRVLFEAFIIMYGGEKHLALGDYLFENELPVFEVAKRIALKDHRLASVKITIPEGFNVLQIADTASEKLKNFNKEKFLLNAKEGYLFPDTYFFFSSDNEENVLSYLNQNYERKIKSIKSEIISSGKTENAIIVMASIIEREAKGDADRGYISGILWNRISKNMPLQVDAAMETYKIKGLPVNPICNPGIKAIKASIHPVASGYLYYLHDRDGLIHYARNFEEHKKNKLKYLK